MKIIDKKWLNLHLFRNFNDEDFILEGENYYITISFTHHLSIHIHNYLSDKVIRYDSFEDDLTVETFKQLCKLVDLNQLKKL